MYNELLIYIKRNKDYLESDMNFDSIRYRNYVTNKNSFLDDISVYQLRKCSILGIKNFLFDNTMLKLIYISYQDNESANRKCAVVTNNHFKTFIRDYKLEKILCQEKKY